MTLRLLAVARRVLARKRPTRVPADLCVRVSDRKIEKVAGMKGLRRASGVFGWWSGLTPDDSPLMLRDVGTQEVYALDCQLP